MIGAGLLAFANYAFAQGAETPTPVEIIAHELSLAQIPMSAAYSESLIDSSAIRLSSPMPDVQGLLERTPAVHVRTPAANGVRTNITFRLFSSSVHIYRGINNPAVTAYNSLGGTIEFEPRDPTSAARGTASFGGVLSMSRTPIRHSYRVRHSPMRCPARPAITPSGCRIRLMIRRRLLAHDAISVFDDTVHVTPGVKYLFARTSDFDNVGFFYPISGSVSDTEHYTLPIDLGMLKDVKVALHVDNLLNRHYYTFGYGDTTFAVPPATTGTPFVRVIYEEPIAFFGSIAVDF